MFIERKGDIFVCGRDGKQKVNLVSNIHEYCYAEKPKGKLNHWEKIFSQTK